MNSLRRRFVVWTRERVPPEWWERTWWLAPALTLALIPVGLPVLLALGWLFNWAGVARASQGLILLAVVSGPVLGFLVLWSIKEADLEPQAQKRSAWLARLAIPGPLLTILTVFWITRLILGE
ncbi:MAG TPA: hypothetical protein VN256_15955 [Pyrinomonadaceae bacterium]|nr:hypothetical protein [Pyrinomonadaceae bacterium]